MDKRLQQDLASLNLSRPKSGAEKAISFIFKLWFVWALLWLTGVGTLIYIAAHFLSKVW